MKPLFAFLALVLVATLNGQRMYGQTLSAQTDGGITPSRVIGEVKVIDSTANLVSVKTDAGLLVSIIVTDSTTLSRLLPGETTLAKATSVTLADLGEGDRVLVLGKVAEDLKSATARTLVVMAKADIAKKQEAERLEWSRRGITGVVSAVKPDTKELTVSTRSGMGSQQVTIAISDNLELRRYAPDSIKFGPSMGPNGGQIFVDGFSGGSMPSKSSIREIRINQNPFAAENDQPSGRVDVLTKPGTDKLRGAAFLNFNDESLNSRNPFVTISPKRTPVQVRQYGGTLSGPLVVTGLHIL